MILAVCQLSGKQVRAVPAAAQNRQKGGKQRVLPAQQQPGGSHQLDIPAAKGTGNHKAEQQHRHTDADRAHQRRRPHTGAQQHPRQPAQGKQQVQLIGQDLRFGVDQRQCKQQPAGKQGNKGKPAHTKQPLAQGQPRAEAQRAAHRQGTAQKLCQQVAHGNFCPAAAAAPAQDKPAEHRHKVLRLQGFAAAGAKAAPG